MKNSYLKLRRPTVPALLCFLPLAATAATEAKAAALRTTEHLNALVPAQTITGRIVDEKGQGMPGVTVLEKGTSNGATTDNDGRYSLTVADNATLTFSFVGYVTQEVAVNGRTSININLAPDSKALNEVVVVGYLRLPTEQVTGSVTQVNQEQIRRAPVASVTEALQGRAAGVQVANSGAPGQNPIVNIRGVGSIQLGSSPLYIVDGVWTNEIRDINPSDIESSTILKDAASLAPYGSRGANGVIIITTRRGKQGKPAFNFNGYAGVQNIAHTYDLAGTAQWADITRQMYENAGQTPFSGAANPPAINTDWQKALIQSGRVQSYNLGLSGASESANYNVSAGYFNQKGTIVGPDFERYSVRVNTGANRGRFRIEQSAQLSRAMTTRVNGLPFIDVIRMLPIIPVRDSATVSGYGFGNTNRITFGTNPVGQQDVYHNTNLENRLIGSLAPEIKLFDFLTYRLNLGMEYVGFLDRTESKYGQAGGLRMNEPVRPAQLYESRGERIFLLAENTLNFQRTFGNHNVSAVAGYTEQKNTIRNTIADAQGFGTGPTYYWSFGAATSSASVGGGTNKWAKRSFLGQVAYDFDDRYLFTGAVRRDGSSLVDPVNKWGTFSAFSLGWRISRESFFENVPLFSDLKLRASYGQLGNDNLSEYLYQRILNPNVNYPLGGGASQPVQNGSTQNQLSSNDLRWEKRKTTNFGFDAGFLDNRLTLAADYYISRTTDALVNPAIPLYEGNVGGNPFTNLGELENRGFEFQAGYQNTTGNFRYGANANLTTLRNRVTRLAFEGQNYTSGPGGVTRTVVGQPVGAFYLMHMLGIFQTQAEIDAYGKQLGAKPGDVKYEDLNNDGIISDADRRFTGSPFPKLQYGFNLTLGYKNFDLAALFQGVQGNDIYNVTRYWTDRMDDNGNFRADIRPWTPSNPSTTTPRPLLGGGQNALMITDRWLENGAYLRLKNLQVSYSLPKTVTEKLTGVGSVRFTLTAQNLLTFTKYTGYDPEIVGAGSLARGVDEGNYPNVRTITGGLQVGF
ncbi:TonB-dependent receptor [Hymenobacter sp. HSC-4F20]|uniref:SusC/RagA family TonB-linked outer membrane protein n=1 Tax=Hymenobacter sp. HSC-4F20 TaxID=2864135 RepID=UPI001C730960|nr:TonB-dependent receptor [Hymenobacter sp. HSC-4F20]MBX0292320.1 TonB-dependent receptor [Hymenobacter sp. HSC-4F20]